MITVASLNRAPILATGRLHGPLKFVGSAQLMRGSVGASARVACRGAAQVCLEVKPDGCTMAPQLTVADLTIYVYFQAHDSLPAS